MVEEAVKLADLCGENELKRFGMTERIRTSQETVSEFDGDSDSDEEGQPVGASDVDDTVEALALKHHDLLQTVGRAHLDGELTENMVKAIDKIQKRVQRATQWNSNLGEHQRKGKPLVAHPSVCCGRFHAFDQDGGGSC